MKIHGYVIGITALLLSASATGCGVESLPEGNLDLSKENLQEVVETVTETTNDVAGKIAEKAEESGLTEKAKDLGKAGAEKSARPGEAGTGAVPLPGGGAAGRRRRPLFGASEPALE